MRVLVTGASRGIGRATALALAKRGDRVAAVGRDEAALDSLVIEGEGRIVAVPSDLTAPSEVRALVERATVALGAVDALAACAGIAEHRPLAAVDEALFDAHFAVNVRAPLILARDLAAHLEERDAEGAIVLLASTLALRGVPDTSVYAASKGALLSLTRTLAVELAPRLRVSCIAPGGVDTDMIRANRRAEDVDALAAAHLVGRLGTADEIAHAVTYLLDARYATGTVLVLDGGLTAR